jgi:hypothetical protein
VGGIAGNVALAAELETAGLPSSDGSRLEAALADLPWGADGGPPSHPDALRYEVELPDEPERGTAVLEEGGLAGDLAPLDSHLRAHGTVEPVQRRRAGS